MCKIDAETGELLSRQPVEEILGKIKKNYDYCKDSDMLEVLFHGKWKNAYHNLLKSAEEALNVYLKDVIYQYKLILNNETGRIYVQKMCEILQAHKEAIGKAVRVGDMQNLDSIVNEIADDCMQVYADYMAADYNNIVMYNTTRFKKVVQA